MKASVLDLRHNMRDIMNALDRGEEVTILHRGQVKGILRTASGKKPAAKAHEHAFFGSSGTAEESVDELMQRLRGGRGNAV